MRRAPIVFIALGAALAASLPAAQGAFPGRDGRVVYAGRIDADWEIYSMRPNGSGVRRLTNNRLDDSAPVWSPNGKQIAFRSERSGNPEIYVMDANGRHVRRLTHSALPDTKPSWSADGKRIVFQHFVEGGSAFVPIESDIAIVTLKGKGVRRLTRTNSDDLNPVWSPDGREIAFRSDRDGNWELYTIRPDGSGIRRLTNNPAVDATPSWSPNGLQLAFTSDRAEQGNFEIYVMNANGSGVRRLTNNPATDFEPALAPDGKRLVFTSDRGGSLQVYSMASNGSDVRQLTHRGFASRTPDWQPLR
jgi:Tol biopolymer transport system component